MDYMYANNQECSSECESGWTLYLDHSSISSFNQENDYIDDVRKNGVFNNEVAKRLNEDEDLSMVSDASSGPPHLHEEEEGYGGNNIENNGCFYNYSIIEDPLCKKNSNKIKNRDKRRRKVQDQSSSLLDDTASSPFFDFSDKSLSLITKSQPSVVENVLEYSQGYSSTQFEVRPSYQEHYDFFQSSHSENHQMQQNQRWFEGKRW